MRNPGIILAIASLGLAVLACQAVTGGGSNTAIPPSNTDNPTSPTTIATQPNSGNVLLQDDFSSTQWGIGTDKHSSL